MKLTKILIFLVFVLLVSGVVMAIVAPYTEECKGSIDFKLDEQGKEILMQKVGDVPGYAQVTGAIGAVTSYASMISSPGIFFASKLQNEAWKTIMAQVPSQVTKMYAQAKVIQEQIKNKQIDIPAGGKISIDCNGKVNYDKVKVNEDKTADLNSECNEANKNECQKLTASGAEVNTVCDKKDKSKCVLEVKTTSAKGQINYGASKSSTWVYSNLKENSKMSFRAVNGKQVIESTNLKLNEKVNKLYLGTDENNRLLDVPASSSPNIGYSMVYDEKGKAVGDTINIEEVTETDSPIVMKDSQTKSETKLFLETCQGKNPPCVKMTQDVAGNADKGYWLESTKKAKIDTGSGAIALTPIKNPITGDTMSSIHTKADGNVDVFNADVNYNGLEFKQLSNKELLRTTISPKPLTADISKAPLKLRGNLVYEDKNNKRFYLATEPGTEIKASLGRTDLSLNDGYQGSIKQKDSTTVVATLDSRPLWQKKEGLEEQAQSSPQIIKKGDKIKAKSSDGASATISQKDEKPKDETPSKKTLVAKKDKDTVAKKEEQVETPKESKTSAPKLAIEDTQQNFCYVDNNIYSFEGIEERSAAAGLSQSFSKCEDLLAALSDAQAQEEQGQSKADGQSEEPEEVFNEDYFKNVPAPDEINYEMYEQAQKFVADSYVKNQIRVYQKCDNIPDEAIKIQCSYYSQIISNYKSTYKGVEIPEEAPAEQDDLEEQGQSIPPPQEQTAEKPKPTQPEQSPEDIITHEDCDTLERFGKSSVVMDKEGFVSFNQDVNNCRQKASNIKSPPPQPPKEEVARVQRSTSPERKNGPMYASGDNQRLWSIYLDKSKEGTPEYNEARCLLIGVFCPEQTKIVSTPIRETRGFL